MPTLPLPPALLDLAADVADAGGRAYVVGGGVRDHLLGRPVKDWDVEVFGLPAADLERLLRRHGPVNAVGRAFGVFKLTVDTREIDVSLPRRDSKVGPGHRGIAVEGDPDMSVDEAVRRRDLTVNAMMVDVVSGDLVDPAGGRQDLQAELLRAVDPAAFLEDPLRAVRVVQFTARLGFDVDPTLERLCRDAALDELPAERIQGEWVKLVLRGRQPSLGLALARRTDLLPRLFPTLVDDPTLDAAVDRAVHRTRDLRPQGRRLAARLLPWLAATPHEGVEPVLDALTLHRWLGYPLRDRLLAAHATLGERPATDADLRHLSTRTELRLWLSAQGALHPDGPWDGLHARAEGLGILDEAPTPLLRGRDLIALGVRPGPAMGALLDRVYTAQLDGSIRTADQAVEAARDLLAES